jgi:hypothetical protein
MGRLCVTERVMNPALPAKSTVPIVGAAPWPISHRRGAVGRARRRGRGGFGGQPQRYRLCGRCPPRPISINPLTVARLNGARVRLVTYASLNAGIIAVSRSTRPRKLLSRDRFHTIGELVPAASVQYEFERTAMDRVTGPQSLRQRDQGAEQHRVRASVM